MTCRAKNELDAPTKTARRVHLRTEWVTFLEQSRTMPTEVLAPFTTSRKTPHEGPWSSPMIHFSPGFSDIFGKRHRARHRGDVPANVWFISDLFLEVEAFDRAGGARIRVPKASVPH